MNSALATVVCVTALKNSVMLMPKAMPGTSALRSSSARHEAALLAHSMTVQMMLEPSIRQNAIVGPGMPAFLISVLLTLNSSTASATPSIPTSTEPRGEPRRAGAVVALVTPASWRGSGCRRMSGSM